MQREAIIYRHGIVVTVFLPSIKDGVSAPRRFSC
jgi:hypothetical protein